MEDTRKWEGRCGKGEKNGTNINLYCPHTFRKRTALQKLDPSGTCAV
jgi:hypothetical protein